MLSESACFCRQCDKTFGVFSGFAVRTAVHSQNTTLSFRR